jgi:hypothetical protein
MRSRLRALFCHAVLVGAVVGVGRPAEVAEATLVPNVPGRTVVVLELFTSQGCSSCPAADRLLSKIGRDENLRDLVIPLAFHVDYWNSLGWSDRLSSAEWTARQNAYAQAFHREEVFTPQLVVNGRVDLNGTDEDGVLRQIDAATTGPSARVSVAVAQEGARRLAVEVTAESAEGLGVKRLDAYVVAFESGLSTVVRRGENSGRTLEDDFVVRRLVRAFSFSPTSGVRRQKRLTIDLDKEWVPANVGVAAFLQDPETMRIYGAAR